MNTLFRNSFGTIFFSKGNSAKLFKCSLALLFFFLATAHSVAQTLTISDAGETGTSGTNWSISGTNPVVILGNGITANVNTSVVEGYLNSGISVLVVGSVVDLAGTINKTTGGDATLTLRAQGANAGIDGYVVVNSAISSSSNKLNVVLWSDFHNHNRSGAAISANITTNGGHLWLGGSSSDGGEDSWNGLTVGNGPSVGSGFANQNAAELTASINTGNGDVLIWAGNTTGAGTQGLATGSSPTINSGTGDIILISDAISGSTTLISTGHLYLAPHDGAYPSALTWSHDNGSPNINVSGTYDALNINAFSSLGGLTIGEYTGMTGITFSNSSNITMNTRTTIAGPLAFVGNHIIIDESLETTASNSDILIKSFGAGSTLNNGYLAVETSDNLTTNGGDIILWSNAANRSSGTANNEIVLRGSNTLSTSGGKIVLAGGLDDGGNGGTASDGIPDGYAYRGGAVGGAFSLGANTKLLSAGGDVIIKGQHTNEDGILGAGSGLIIDSGSGTITMHGKSVSNHGINLEQGNFAITSSSTADTAISIEGETQDSGNNSGLLFSYTNTAVSSLIQTTGASGGGILLEGNNSSGLSGFGIWFGITSGFAGNTQILSNTGDITLASTSRIYTDNQSVYLGNRKDATAVNGITPLSTTASGAITFTTDTFVFSTNYSNTISTSGALTIEPNSNAFSSAFNWNGTLSDLDSDGVSDDWLGSTAAASTLKNFRILNVASLSGLTIGKAANTANVTFGSATTIAGPISIYGGSIGIESNITATSGDILLDADTGTALNTAKDGIEIDNGVTIETITSGDITLIGRSGNGATALQGIDGAINGTATIVSAGKVNLTGITESTAIANSPGVWYEGNITAGGDIRINGQAEGTNYTYDIYLKKVALETTNGEIILDAQNLGFLSFGGIDSATSFDNSVSAGGGKNITLYGNKHRIFHDNTTTTFTTTGQVSMLAGHNDTGTAQTSFTQTVDLDKYRFDAGITGFTIGNTGNTANITIPNAITIAGPISVYGGDIAVNENLNTTAGNATGDILLKASADISLAASKSVTTNDGDVVLWSNSDGQAANGSVLLRSASSISTGGGHLWIGGGSGSTTWNALTVGDGYAVSGTSIQPPVQSPAFSGIYLEKASINTSGGHVYLAGAGTSAHNGILTYDVNDINAGSGTITLKGGTGATAGRGMAVSIHSSTTPGSLTLTSTSTAATAIDIEVNSTSNFGISLEGTLNVLSTNTGGISLVSLGGGGSAGLRLGLGSGSDARLGVLNVLGTSGNILVNLGEEGINVQNNISSASIGGKASTAVESSSSNIQFISDDVTAAGALNFSTSGTLAIEPFGTSFSSTLNTSSLTYTGGISGLTLGKATNTAGITIGSATTIAGPISVYGGTLALNGALTASSNTISLTASTAVTQSAALTANNLSLNGTGNFTLQNTSNNVGTIAVGSSTTRLGNLAYRDNNALQIGTVGSQSGIFSSGTILAETESGNLTLSENINTSSTSDDAIIVNAGRTAAAATATGGDVIVSGSPTLSYGSGGRAKLFSGQESNSTGLTTLVGGSANTRSGFDETSDLSGENLADDNAYAIYRLLLQVER